MRLIDAPAFGRPVRIVWRKRRWRCPEPACRTATFVEQNAEIAAPRAKLTTRACWWAIGQLRREHGSVNGIPAAAGVRWRIVWEAIQPLLQAAADVEYGVLFLPRIGDSIATAPPRLLDQEAVWSRRPALHAQVSRCGSWYARAAPFVDGARARASQVVPLNRRIMIWTAPKRAS